VAEIRQFKLKEQSFNNVKVIDKNPSVKIIDMGAWECERDERIMQRQYEEFISLLKYFVHVQVPKYDVVYITFESSDMYRITDKDGYAIDTEIIDILSSDFILADHIISSLLNLSPNKIVVVNSSYVDDETRKTLSKVFEERIVF
jgi:hypothetical protein